MNYKCPKCGNLVEEGVNPCPTCGQQFNWPSVTPPKSDPIIENVKEKNSTIPVSDNYLTYQKEKEQIESKEKQYSLISKLSGGSILVCLFIQILCLFGAFEENVLAFFVLAAFVIFFLILWINFGAKAGEEHLNLMDLEDVKDMNEKNRELFLKAKREKRERLKKEHEERMAKQREEEREKVKQRNLELATKPTFHYSYNGKYIEELLEEITDYQIMDAKTDGVSALGRGLVGAAVIGPVGMLAATGAKREYSVLITHRKNGKQLVKVSTNDLQKLVEYIENKKKKI